VEWIGPSGPSTITPATPRPPFGATACARSSTAAGSYDEAATSPLADAKTVEDIHALHWPSPDDFDWDGFKRRVKEVSGRQIVQCGGYEPFLVYCYMRGREQAMMDVLVEPEIAEADPRHLFDFHYAVNGRPGRSVIV